jgi:enoyl-CoA hydratase/carnithine racemase
MEYRMSEDLVLRDLDDEGVMTLTFNRPERRNAFNPGLFRAVADAVAEVNEDPRVAVVVLTGAGDDFSSGLDLAEFGGDDSEPQPFELMMDSICALDKPLLAAAKGCAIGFGVTSLFHCDVVYLGESARMRMPFASLGLVTEAAACYLAPEVMGRKQAAELIFTAGWFDAAKALDYGIATAVVPDAELQSTTLAKAREIAQWPVSSLVEIKRIMKATHADSIERARKLEFDAMRKLGGGPENSEAITAFLSKREPDFKQFRK